MLINADLTRRVTITADQHRWIPSPQQGVERMMLDRIGAEAGRATSLVRYAPNSHYPKHEHPGGEEILVLSGTFCEGDEQYPTGWYLRNPPGSSHLPSTQDGALIFVKLWQMPANEMRRVRIDTRSPLSWRLESGCHVCSLFCG